MISGPLCTQSLADLGADVIKVETPESGDDTRQWPPFHGPGFGAVFMAMNRNKRSIALDLKSGAGQKIVHDMIRECDIFVENFSTGVAERLGVDAATLRSINPALIYCTISGYGRDGPMKGGAGYDVILQAFSGIMSLTGEPGGGHIRSPISPIDYSTGMHAFAGVLAALIQRGQTGKGVHIEVSLLDTAMSLLGYSLQGFWETGKQPARCGSSHDGLCPYQAFDAADGPVMIGVANDGLWRKFCRIADLDIADDPRFRTNPDRVRNRPELLAIVKAAVKERTVAYWVEHLSAAGVPVAPINGLAEALAHPQTVSREIILEYATEAGDVARTVDLPIRLDHGRRQVDRPPPRLGQHSREILEQFGFDEEQIAGWVDAGIVGGERP